MTPSLMSSTSTPWRWALSRSTPWVRRSEIADAASVLARVRLQGVARGASAALRAPVPCGLDAGRAAVVRRDAPVVSAALAAEDPGGQRHRRPRPGAGAAPPAGRVE